MPDPTVSQRNKALLQRQASLSPPRFRAGCAGQLPAERQRAAEPAYFQLWLISRLLSSPFLFSSLLFSFPLLQKENALYLGHMAWFRPLGGKKKSENLRGLQRLKGFKSWQSEIAQSCPTLRPYGPYVAFQALSSMGFSRHEYWSGLPFPSPGDLPDSGIKLRSLTLQADSLPSEPPGNPPGVKSWQRENKG